MADRLADAVVVAHFAFLAFLVLGGFLAWRWRWVLPVHVAVVAYGAGIVAIGWPCPLTDIENALRGSELDGGFIATYVTGVIYPGDLLTEVRTAVALLVGLSWLGFVVRRRRVSAKTR